METMLCLCSPWRSARTRPAGAGADDVSHPWHAVLGAAIYEIAQPPWIREGRASFLNRLPLQPVREVQQEADLRIRSEEEVLVGVPDPILAERTRYLAVCVERLACAVENLVHPPRFVGGDTARFRRTGRRSRPPPR